MFEPNPNTFRKSKKHAMSRSISSRINLFIIEAFVYEASIAGDPGISRPAVDVAVLWVCWVREEVHGGLGDAFSGGADGAMVGADEVALSSE